MHINENFAINY